MIFLTIFVKENIKFLFISHVKKKKTWNPNLHLYNTNTIYIYITQFAHLDTS